MTKDKRVVVRQVLLITLVLNLLVMFLKASVGLLTGSLSLLSDALHSVTDSANNILGLVASRFSSPEPDREHPYGHQKFEALGALGIAAFLGIACFEILSGAIDRILHPSNKALQITASELWIVLLVLGINIFVAFYERHVGQKIGNAILIADAKHTMSDIWVTITVLAGLLAIWIGGDRYAWLPWIDVVLSFPVALLVFYSGWTVIRDNLPWLVDEMAIAPEAIHAIAIQVPGVLNCHEIASRGIVGRQVFIEMHLVVNVTDVETSHQITEEIEDRLLRHYGPARIVIHVEPPRYYSEQISYQAPS